MPTLEDVPRTDHTIEEYMSSNNPQDYEPSEHESSESDHHSDSDTDDNHDYPFSSKEQQPFVASSQAPQGDPLKPYSCHICSFNTKYRSNLSKHITNQHSNRQFKCDQCEFITNKKRSLTVHKKTHIIAEPCQDSTGEDSGEDVIFKITKDKLIPAKKGNQLPSSKTHTQSHTQPHTQSHRQHCVLCGKDFSSKAVLDRHMLVHQRKPDHPEIKISLTVRMLHNTVHSPIT